MTKDKNGKFIPLADQVEIIRTENSAGTDRQDTDLKPYLQAFAEDWKTLQPIDVDITTPEKAQQSVEFLDLVKQDLDRRRKTIEALKKLLRH